MRNISDKILDKKYFIFDIDGTLLDTMGMWTCVDQTIINELTGIYYNENYIKEFRDSVLYASHNLGRNVYDVYAEECLKHYGLHISAEEFNNSRAEMSRLLAINEIDYKPGADKVLSMLQNLGKKLAVASTTTRQYYRFYSQNNQKLKNKFDLDKFIDVKILCEDVSKGKPDPEAYLLAMKKLGAKPEECIVFEDSLNGVISAKTAGIDVVTVYDKSAETEQELIAKIADYKIDSFEEFYEILNNLINQSQPQ